MNCSKCLSHVWDIAASKVIEGEVICGNCIHNWIVSSCKLINILASNNNWIGNPSVFRDPTGKGRSVQQLAWELLKGNSQDSNFQINSVFVLLKKFSSSTFYVFGVYSTRDKAEAASKKDFEDTNGFGDPKYRIEEKQIQ